MSLPEAFACARRPGSSTPCCFFRRWHRLESLREPWETTDLMGPSNVIKHGWEISIKNEHRERETERDVYIYTYASTSLSLHISVYTHTHIYITHTHTYIYIYSVCVWFYEDFPGLDGPTAGVSDDHKPNIPRSSVKNARSFFILFTSPGCYQVGGIWTSPLLLLHQLGLEARCRAHSVVVACPKTSPQLYAQGFTPHSFHFHMYG